jgi:hypothetical protein
MAAPVNPGSFLLKIEEVVAKLGQNPQPGSVVEYINQHFPAPSKSGSNPALAQQPQNVQAVFKAFIHLQMDCTNNPKQVSADYAALYTAVRALKEKKRGAA